MIIDSSAVVAIVKGEPEAEPFTDAIIRCNLPEMSAAGYLEIGIVIDRLRDPVLSADVDRLLEGLAVQISPVTEAQARIARQAYRDFGKGGGHKAQLNFGDCFAYALAMERGEPLLFKGADFAHTGVEQAL